MSMHEDGQMVDFKEDEIGSGKRELDDADYLDMAKRSFKHSDTFFEKSIRPELNSNIRQFNGEHEPDSKYRHKLYKHQSKFFKNKTATVIRKHEAAAASAMFSTNSVVVVEPMDHDDEVSVASAAYYSELLNIRLTESCSWFDVFMAAYQDSMVAGWTIGKVEFDLDKKIPKLRVLEPENIRIDPTCDWMDPIGSTPYIIEIMEMEAGDVVRRSKDKESMWIPISFEDVAKAEGISETEYIRMAREFGKIDPKQEEANVLEHRKVAVHFNLIRVEGEDVVFFTLSDRVLLSKPRPLSDLFPHGIRPYVFGKCVVDSHRVYPRSVVRMLRDFQRELNDISNLRVDNVRHAIHGRTFIKRGQNVDLDSIRMSAPGSVTMLNDPVGDVNFTRPPDVTQSSYRETELLNIEMDDISGTFSGATVQGSRMISETVGGPSLLNSNASQVSEYQVLTFKNSFAIPMLRLTLETLRALENDDEVMARALRQALDKNPDLVLDNPDLFDMEVKLSVSIGMGNVNPVARLEKFRMGLQTIQSIAPGVSAMLDEVAVAEEVFGIMGIDNGRRFFKGSRKDDPRIAALEQQVQMLQQKLEAKKPQELVDAEVEFRKAQTVKTKIEATFGAMQAGESIAVMPAVAPIGDKLLQTSGWVNAAGEDPNFPMTAGQAGVSDETMALAKMQAEQYNTPQNPDGTEPATGQRGISTGFRAGITGIKDRDA